MNSKQKQIFTSYPTKNSNNTKKISIEIKTSAVYVDRIVFFELPQNFLENVPIINPLTCKRRLR